MLPDPETPRRDRRTPAPRLSGLSARLMLVVLVFAVVMAGAYYWLVHRPLYEQLRGLDETEVRLLFRNLRNQLIERSLADSELKRQRGELQALANEMSRVEQRTRHEIAGELHECITSASRLTNRLAQPVIQQLGLAKALEALVASHDAQHDVEFVVETGPMDQPIDADSADIVYRGVAELLHNIVKHANVDRAVLRMDSENGSLHIEVEDDGVGFRTEPLPPREGQIRGFGLFSFRERVRQIGGSLSIESNPDRGCLVTVVIPLKAGSEVRREEIESR